MRHQRPNVLLTIATWVLVIIFIFPVFWTILNGFKSEFDATANPPKFLFSPDLAGYELVAQRGMLAYLWNSVVASIGSTVVVMLLSIPAAYALSVREIKQSQNTLFFLISTRFLPVAAGILPLYLILKNLGFLDNVWALAIIYAAINIPLAIWMLRSFFMEIPKEVTEAARIDGAGIIRELVRIVVPITIPGIVAAALICFIFAWNEYFIATLVTGATAKTTPPFLASFVDGRGFFLAVLSSAATLAALPVVVVGWLAQKHLVRGLSLGAIK